VRKAENRGSKNINQMNNTGMKEKLSLLILFSAVSITVHAQITKIEHFFASSPHAEKFFQFFSRDLGLPEVWNYQSWGDFSSGGVTLGNVAFELVNYKGVNKTSFDGIALEPRQPVEEFIKELDKTGIAHDTIQPNTWINEKGTLVGWSTLGVKDVLPDEVNLFVCDYKNREGVLAGRKRASEKLKELNGGYIGVVSLKEIVIGATNIKKYKAELKQLPGIRKGKKGLFHFREGPSIKLHSAKRSGIEKIILNVQSLTIASQFLQDKNWLGKSTKNSISILPQVVEGLIIELVEK
jgi:hypothetical protein